jgi:hypothetical protein
MKCLLLLQALLTFQCDGDGPVRFGFPLRERDLAAGLRLDDPNARLQWRPLQPRPDPQTGRRWVELAVVGARGRVVVHAGGGGPADPRQGAILRCAESSDGDRSERRWLWCTGDADRAVRTTFRTATPLGDEVCLPGEAHSELSAALRGRCLRVRIAPGRWHQAGVLPHLGARAETLRTELAAIGRGLIELPGPRGAGDFARSGGVVTNLEFDTPLAFLRLGLATADAELLRRGLAAAQHLVDHDLDRVSGLPFRHGTDHRRGPPEPGHTWIEGLLLGGCLAADDELIAGARSIAHSLARHPPRPAGDREHARDFAWPLLALETWLRFDDSASCERAADAFADAIAARWDAAAGAVRFGEGERGQVYEERLWLTGGMLLPALRAHLLRRADARIGIIVDELERRLAQLVRRGREGVPVRCWLRDGRIVAEVRLRQMPEVFFVLEGLAAPDLLRLLKRDHIQRAASVADAEDPDLSTSFTLAARCAWILR